MGGAKDDWSESTATAAPPPNYVSVRCSLVMHSAMANNRLLVAPLLAPPIVASVV